MVWTIIRNFFGNTFVLFSGISILLVLIEMIWYRTGKHKKDE